MLRQSMVVESKRREEKSDETVAVLDIPRIKGVLGTGNITEAAYLLQVLSTNMITLYIKWRHFNVSVKLMNSRTRQYLYYVPSLKYIIYLIKRYYI